MCGLIVYTLLNNGELPSGLNAGLNALRHRGPDAQAEFRDANVFLGHARLKILDLSDTANQPMSCDRGRFWIVFNGEIYNYQEIRSELAAKGWTLNTTGDTEVLLKSYIDSGEDCLRRLNGMFAFVIYDKENRSFFAARDHFGIKPLYYCWDGRQLAFASEIRALLEAGVVPAEIDPQAVDEYLTWGSVIAPRTMIKGIRCLMPGHQLTFKAGRLEMRPYWALPNRNSAPTDSGIGENEAARRIRAVLEDAVRLQLISDVPLGAFLSGGVDSTAIVGLMSRLGVAEINTFSIGFDCGRDRYDETGYARETARRFKTRHHEIIMDGRTVIDAIEPFANSLDQPSVDGLNTFLISRFARDYATVCLSGLGGDEIFAGYHTVKWLHLFDRLDRFRPPLPASCGRMSRWVYDRLPSHLRTNHLVRGGAFCAGAFPSDIDRYRMVRMLFTPDERRRLTGRANGARLAGNEFGFLREMAPVDRALYLDQAIYMSNTLLRDVDVMSMAHALEIRVPFLESRIAELVASFPPELKYRRNHFKRLLIRAVGDVLPPDLEKRRKMGFTFPLHLWSEEPRMRSIMEDCLSPDSLAMSMLLDRKGAGEVIARNRRLLQTGQSRYAFNQLWSLMMLELWLRKNAVAAPRAAAMAEATA